MNLKTLVYYKSHVEGGQRYMGFKNLDLKNPIISMKGIPLGISFT